MLAGRATPMEEGPRTSISFILSSRQAHASVVTEQLRLQRLPSLLYTSAAQSLLETEGEWR